MTSTPTPLHSLQSAPTTPSPYVDQHIGHPSVVVPTKRKRSNTTSSSTRHNRQSPVVPTKSPLTFSEYTHPPPAPTSPTPGAANPANADTIQCICGFTHDDGFSIACDVCGRWCHASCFEIRENEVPEVWKCIWCSPRPIDKDRAVRLQRQRKKEMELAAAYALNAVAGSSSLTNGVAGGGRGGGAGHGQGQGHAGAAVAGASGTKKRRERRSSTSLPSSSSASGYFTQAARGPSSAGASGTVEDEHVDIEEDWRSTYVHIDEDIVPQQETREKLRRHAKGWRGVSALSQSPEPPYSTQSLPAQSPSSPYPFPYAYQASPMSATIMTSNKDKGKSKEPPLYPFPVSVPVPLHHSQYSLHSQPKRTAVLPVPRDLSDPTADIRPRTYSLHTTKEIPRKEFVVGMKSTIVPSSAYLSDPLNAYAHLGMPKPHVHLIPPPLDVALDARTAGNEARFVRSGCKPNAVLRPVLCQRARSRKKERDKEKGKEKEKLKGRDGVNGVGGNGGADLGSGYGKEKSKSVDGVRADVGMDIDVDVDVEADGEVEVDIEAATPDGSTTHHQPPIHKQSTVASDSETTESDDQHEQEHAQHQRNSASCPNPASEPSPRSRTPSPTIEFAIFALRDLKAQEEVVLGWEWDDGSVVHELPALVKMLAEGEVGENEGKSEGTEGRISAQHLMRLKLQMQNLIHSLDSNFTTCACGQKAHGCALKLMDSFVDMIPSRFPESQTRSFPTTQLHSHPHRPQSTSPYPGSSPSINTPGHPLPIVIPPTADTTPAALQALQLQSFAKRHLHLNPESDSLGPLVGTSRGFRTRVIGGANAGGMNGVESVPTNPYDADSHASDADDILLQNKNRANGVPASSGLANAKTKTKAKSKDRADGRKSLGRTFSTQTHLLEVPQIHLQVPSPRKSRSKTRSARVSSAGPSENRDIMVDGSSGSKPPGEESIPPRMRKKWIRQSSEALKESNGSGSGSSSSGNGASGSASGNGNGTGSGMSTPTMEIDISEKGGFYFQRRTSDVRTHLVEIDAELMPPPPLPPALDPTTIKSSSLSPSVRHKSMPPIPTSPVPQPSPTTDTPMSISSFSNLSIRSPTTPLTRTTFIRPQIANLLHSDEPPQRLLRPEGISAPHRSYSDNQIQTRYEPPRSMDSMDVDMRPVDPPREEAAPSPIEQDPEPILNKTPTTPSEQLHVRFMSPPPKSMFYPPNAVEELAPKETPPPQTPFPHVETLEEKVSIIENAAVTEQPVLVEEEHVPEEHIEVKEKDDEAMDVDISIEVPPSPTPLLSMDSESTREQLSVSMTPSPITPSPLELPKEEEVVKEPDSSQPVVEIGVEVEAETQIPTLSSEREESHETPTPTPEPEPPKVRRTMADYAQRRRKQKEEEAAKAQAVQQEETKDSGASIEVSPVLETLIQKLVADSILRSGAEKSGSDPAGASASVMVTAPVESETKDQIHSIPAPPLPEVVGNVQPVQPSREESPMEKDLTSSSTPPADVVIRTSSPPPETLDVQPILISEVIAETASEHLADKTIGQEVIVSDVAEKEPLNISIDAHKYTDVQDDASSSKDSPNTYRPQPFSEAGPTLMHVEEKGNEHFEREGTPSASSRFTVMSPSAANNMEEDGEISSFSISASRSMPQPEIRRASTYRPDYSRRSPPTQPRSFRSTRTPPRSGSPPPRHFPPSRSLALSPHSRPVPSGPRALRDRDQPSYRASSYVPRAPIADRDRDRDRDRDIRDRDRDRPLPDRYDYDRRTWSDRSRGRGGSSWAR